MVSIKKTWLYLSTSLLLIITLISAFNSTSHAQDALTPGEEAAVEFNESECDFGVILNHTMCPMFNATNELIFQWFAEDQVFRKFMTINFETGAGLGSLDPGEIEAGATDGTENGDLKTDMETMWTNVRNLTNALFVILFVIAILGHVTGAVEAYTAKKIIPRIVIAAVLTQLSWFISTELSAIVDDFGVGIGDLIEGQLNVKDKNISDIVLSDETEATAAGATTVAASFFYIIATKMAAATALTAGNALWVLVPFVLTVLVAIIVSIITLLARKVILIMLVILSPIALVMWALPATEKWAKRWFSWYTVILMMYPMMMMAIAIGKALGVILSGAASDATAERSWVFQIAGLLVWIAPYIMLPFIIRLAMSTFSNVTGAIDNAGKSISGRVKNYSKTQREGLKGMRQSQAAKQYQNARDSQGSFDLSDRKGRRAARKNRRSMLANRAFSGHAMPTKYNNQAIDEFADSKEKEEANQETSKGKRRTIEYANVLSDTNKGSDAAYSMDSQMIVSKIEAEATRVGGAENLSANDRLIHDMFTAERERRSDSFLARSGKDEFSTEDNRAIERESIEHVASQLMGDKRNLVDQAREEAHDDKAYGGLDTDAAKIEDTDRILSAATGDRIQLLSGEEVDVTSALQFAAFKDSFENYGSSMTAARTRRDFVQTRQDSTSNSAGDQRSIQNVMSAFAGQVMGKSADYLVFDGGAISAGYQKLYSYEEGDFKRLLADSGSGKPKTVDFKAVVDLYVGGSKDPYSIGAHTNAKGQALRAAAEQKLQQAQTKHNNNPIPQNESALAVMKDNHERVMNLIEKDGSLAKGRK